VTNLSDLFEQFLKEKQYIDGVTEKTLRTYRNLVIRVEGKGQKERIVPFSIESRKLLYRWLQTGFGISQQGLRRPFSNAASLPRRYWM
jgi:integrase